MLQKTGSLAEHADRQTHSGLTIVEYCRKNKVNAGSLYTYLYKQRKEKLPKAKQKSHDNKHKPILTFEQIHQALPTVSLPSPIELIFPNGIKAVLPAEFNEVDLEKVIAVFAQRSIRELTC